MINIHEHYHCVKCEWTLQIEFLFPYKIDEKYKIIHSYFSLKVTKYNRKKKSINVIKYRDSKVDITRDGPQTYEWTKENGDETCLLVNMSVFP